MIWLAETGVENGVVAGVASAARERMASGVEMVQQRRVSVVEPRVVIAHDVWVIQRRQHLNLPRQSLPHHLADGKQQQFVRTQEDLLLS